MFRLLEKHWRAGGWSQDPKAVANKARVTARMDSAPAGVFVAIVSPDAAACEAKTADPWRNENIWKMENPRNLSFSVEWHDVTKGSIRNTSKSTVPGYILRTVPGYRRFQATHAQQEEGYP